jgi:hypothetical protein
LKCENSVYNDIERVKELFPFVEAIGRFPGVNMIQRMNEAASQQHEERAGKGVEHSGMAQGAAALLRVRK